MQWPRQKKGRSACRMQPRKRDGEWAIVRRESASERRRSSTLSGRPFASRALARFHTPSSGLSSGGVRRKVLEAETGHPTAEGADGITAVNLAVVPDDDHGPAQVAQQVPKKVTYLCVLDVLGMEAPIEAHAPAPRADRDAGDDRNLVPSIAMPDDRRLAARRPGPPHGRNQQEARFVDEDEMGAQPRSVFFTRGQASRFHCSMAASSRLRARVSGFCGVHSS